MGRIDQPVETRHKQHVALAQSGKRSAELGAVGLRAADGHIANLLGSGGAEGFT